ncbi:MAG: adenylate/guanylate cyclase domain-containing protein [Microscillaceae bacterium]|jgi:class 3 adenylate cyclase|nr:adenylate/guanylate cyclase domain-containing protein [Microscillaceae bacterium]
MKIAYLVIFLSFLLVFSACKVKTPIAQKGYLDLRNTTLSARSPLELMGEWEFYWAEFLNSNDFIAQNNLSAQYIKVPASWTVLAIEGKKLPVFGYATYRLRVDLPAHTREVGLYIPKIWSASKVWANGKLVASRGQISRQSNHEYQNQILEDLVKLNLSESYLEIIIQVANYDVTVAGLVQNLRLGHYAAMQGQANLLNVRELMWIGCLFLMCLYHFILFVYRPRNTYYLYFGIACLLIAARIVVFGEHYLYAYLKEYTGVLDFTWQSKVYYLSSFLLIPVALFYFRELYPQATHSWVVKASGIVLGGYCVAILVFSPAFLATTLGVFEIISILFEIYLVWVLVWATWRHSQDSFVQMIGILLIVFASINDTLHAEELELVGSIELTPLMFSVFVLLQMFILARRFSRAFSQVEDLSKNLEKKVEERTNELNHTLQIVEQERQKSDKLLLNILPEETAQELKEKGSANPHYYPLVTVLFTDFKGFTQIAEQLEPQQVIEELNQCFLAFDEICERHNLEKIKTIGDSYMCAGGVPVANTRNPWDCVSAGLEMQKWMQNWKIEKEKRGEPVWEVRIGIHSGEVIAGVIGKNKFAYDIWGDTVNLASRMESSGEAGKVNISQTTYALVKDDFDCTFRGKIQAKNKGEIEMYFVNREWISNEQ